MFKAPFGASIRTYFGTLLQFTLEIYIDIKHLMPCTVEPALPSQLGVKSLKSL